MAVLNAICKQMVRDNLMKCKEKLLEQVNREDNKVDDRESSQQQTFAQVREDVQLASNFSTLNEKYFAQKETLTFVQMHAVMPYMRISPLTEMFHALLVTDSQNRMKGIIEQILWQVGRQKSIHKIDAC